MLTVKFPNTAYNFLAYCINQDEIPGGNICRFTILDDMEKLKEVFSLIGKEPVEFLDDGKNAVNKLDAPCVVILMDINTIGPFDQHILTITHLQY